jgi:hypothetical protein
MTDEVFARRSLELLMRRAEAQERLLERGLDRLTDDQRRARRSIEARLQEQPWRKYV